MAKGDDIEERLIEFAVRIVRLSTALPGNTVGKHIADQVLRSGTAPAAEARGAESRNDFIHKLRICLKELNETRVWRKIIIQSELLPQSRLQNILQESDELCRIINSSLKTTKTNQVFPIPNSQFTIRH